jgi:hypothetical protein
VVATFKSALCLDGCYGFGAAKAAEPGRTPGDLPRKSFSAGGTVIGRRPLAFAHCLGYPKSLTLNQLSMV